MSILTWEYYHSLHDKIAGQESFTKPELLAEKEVCNIMGVIRYNELIAENENLKNEPFYEQLLDCLCNIIDYQQTVGAKAGNGVASASNDGYSETYVIKTTFEAHEELKKNIRAWLSGTGLIGAY